MALLAGVLLFATDSLLVPCLALLLIDIPYRLVKRDRRDSVLAGLVAPHVGGHVFFIPCWAWGIVLQIASMVFGGEPSAPPRAGGDEARCAMKVNVAKGRTIRPAGARAASVEFHLRVLALGTLAVFGAVPFTGCVSYRLYGHRTLGGASISVPEVARLKPDQTPADVRALLGDP